MRACVCLRVRGSKTCCLLLFAVYTGLVFPAECSTLHHSFTYRCLHVRDTMHSLSLPHTVSHIPVACHVSICLYSCSGGSWHVAQKAADSSSQLSSRLCGSPTGGSVNRCISRGRQSARQSADLHDSPHQLKTKQDSMSMLKRQGRGGNSLYQLENQTQRGHYHCSRSV